MGTMSLRLLIRFVSTISGSGRSLQLAQTRYQPRCCLHPWVLSMLPAAEEHLSCSTDPRHLQRSR
ncbi:hypothetical protein PsYK624_117600 [Phanerochaete sordida]|uniref:Uncharacterized protein n=1 Tax=Phanerochaete sordida TaxID=48140 RepID=A0A9P3LIE0_9APHY|nr:hypothetical protein PsYK624_117600 [Phanerochaete sordida]